MNGLKNKVVFFAIEAQRLPAQEMLEQRREHNPLLRLAMVGTYKSLNRAVMRSLSNNTGGTYVGMGGEQIVFKDSRGEVVKVLRETIGVRASEVSELSLSRQRDTDKAAEYMGDHWIETVFYPMKMPRLVGGYAVAAVQPEIRPIEAYERAEDILQSARIPNALSDLKDFVARVRLLNEETGMYPDFMGPGNVVMAPGMDGFNTLQVIDTIPVSKQKLQSSIMEDGTSRQQFHDALVDRLEAFCEEPIELSESRVAALR